MLTFFKKLWIGDDNDEYSFSLTMDNEDEFETTNSKQLTTQLRKDGLATIDDDNIEAQYLDCQITNHTLQIPDPETIKKKILFYRYMAENFYIDDAITTIKNEAIIEEKQKIVSLDLTEVDVSKAVKDKIHNEFNEILRIIKFRKNASKWFEQFYVDGRGYFRMIFDTEDLKKGIIGIQKLDSVCVEKFYSKEHDKVLYQYKDLEDRGFAITENAMIAINSGKMNAERTMYISYLERAIKPFNLLTLLVDAMAVYRITRAPERRVFNISTGRLAPKKAKQYVKDVISKLKNNMTYDSSTGNITQQHRSLTMVEDFYFPKSHDDKGTTVETLAAGAQLGEISDIEFLERNLIKSLFIPVSRADTDKSMSSIFGNNTSDIESEENRLAKFINHSRYQFRDILIKPLKFNLILKKIITPDEWDEIDYKIDLNWVSDSHVAELKFLEKIERRNDVADSLQDKIGIIFSQEWINTNIWNLTDDEIQIQKQQIEEENKQNNINKGNDDETDDI